MVKKHYLKELNIQSTYIKKGDKGDDVRRVQEWIALWTFKDSNFKIGIARDGDFGPGTLRAVKKFQEFKNLQSDGIVGNITWRALTQPMVDAYTRTDENTIGNYILAYGKQHFKAVAREFTQNIGPWVRAYMNGLEGAIYPWCMGFVQTVLDQAYTSMGKLFTDDIPFTYSCDVVGEHALSKNKLIRNEKLKEDSSDVKPGDIFLVCSKTNPHDWKHTGFVVKIEDGVMHTLEGNTNDEGSREGYEVCKRERKINEQNLDVFRLIP